MLPWLARASSSSTPGPSPSSAGAQGDTSASCPGCAIERRLMLPQPLPCPDKPRHVLLHEMHLP